MNNATKQVHVNTEEDTIPTQGKGKEKGNENIFPGCNSQLHT